jgi:hypothetical protein
VKVLVVLLALLLAGGLWWLLTGGPSSGGGRPSGPSLSEAEKDDPDVLYLTRGSGAVTLWVKTQDGGVPLGAEVGLRHRGKTVWLYADHRGRRLFTGAPLGRVQAVAKAPGYRETVTDVVVDPGFVSDSTLVLTPE